MVETISTFKTALVQELPIGDRELTSEEQADRLLCGLSPEEIADMTPGELNDLANYTMARSSSLLGS